MTALRAEFLKVLPADIGRVGALGAAILALVRYVTAVSEDGASRLLIDGSVWWRASHSEIGRSLGGVTHDSVRRELGKLCRDGHLRSVPADLFAGDQTKAYQVYDQPLRDSASVPDQPLRDSASPLRTFASVPTRMCVGTDAKSRRSPISIELEEAEEARSIDPDQRQPPTSGPFGPRCRKHSAVEHPGPCGGCGAAQRAYNAAMQAYEAGQNARRRAIREAIDACPDCDDVGRLDDDQSDCPKHPNNRQRRGAVSG